MAADRLLPETTRDSAPPKDSIPLLRTALYATHIRYRAKMVSFAGYEMPFRYPEGEVAEHNAVRKGAGLFDVSHMGRLKIVGPDALNFINYLTINDAFSLVDNQIQYSAMCNEDGGVRDDILVYRRGPESLVIVVNAANHQADREWMEDYQTGFNVTVEDVTDETALLALQGPRAQDVLSRLTSLPLDEIEYYHFLEGEVDGVVGIVSRTGYTREDGFELLVPASQAEGLWDKIIVAGQDFGILPCGLVARDSLRREVGYPLHGHEISEAIDPYTGGLGWITMLDKGNFIGREALLERKANQTEHLVMVVVQGPGIPRDEGCQIIQNGKVIGPIVSGGPAISKGNVGIGMGFVPMEVKSGQAVEVDIRGRRVPALIAGTRSLYKGSAKIKPKK